MRRIFIYRPRLWLFFTLLDILLRRFHRPWKLPIIILEYAYRMMWKYRRRKWGYETWILYRQELLRFFLRMLIRLVEAIASRNRRLVLPLFRLYTGALGDLYTYAWASEYWYSLTPAHREVVAREVINALLGRRRPWRLETFSAEGLAILDYVAYRMGITSAPGQVGGILILPMWERDVFGEWVLTFFALIIPKHYITPDPWVGLCALLHLREFEYRWKWEFEDVPVDSPYRKDPEKVAYLFDELARAFYEDEWFLVYESPTKAKTLLLSSIGAPENWWKAMSMGSYAVRMKTQEPFLHPLQRRGVGYWFKTILFYLGFRV